jgi:hypothetical protein
MYICNGELHLQRLNDGNLGLGICKLHDIWNSKYKYLSQSYLLIHVNNTCKYSTNKYLEWKQYICTETKLNLVYNKLNWMWICCSALSHTYVYTNMFASVIRLVYQSPFWFIFVRSYIGLPHSLVHEQTNPYKVSPHLPSDSAVGYISSESRSIPHFFTEDWSQFRGMSRVQTLDHRPSVLTYVLHSVFPSVLPDRYLDIKFNQARTVFFTVFHLLVQSPFHSALDNRYVKLMMEAVRTSETSVDNHITRQYIPEDNSEHHTRRRENLKSHTRSACLCCSINSLMPLFSSNNL